MAIVVILTYILTKFLHAHYFFGVLNHKLKVYHECRKLGLPVMISLKHDSSKFKLDEYFAYAHYWRSPLLASDKVAASFQKAKTKHDQRNSHHWEYWLDDSKNPQPMDEISLLEMIADWRAAASRHAGLDDTLSYYKRKHNHIILHPDTRAKLEKIIGYSDPSL
jgi:hypothetical protein